MFDEILGEEKKIVYKDIDNPNAGKQSPEFGDVWKKNQKLINKTMAGDNEYEDEYDDEYEDLQLESIEYI